MAQETCKLIADLCHESEKGQLSIVGRLLACDRKQRRAGRARLAYESVIEVEADLAALSSFFAYPSLTVTTVECLAQSLKSGIPASGMDQLFRRTWSGFGGCGWSSIKVRLAKHSSKGSLIRKTSAQQVKHERKCLKQLSKNDGKPLQTWVSASVIIP
jgi:hypothetical protein